MQRPGAPLAAATLAIAAIASACGDDPARVSLTPVAIAGSTCGRPADGRSLLVTALGEQREDVRPVDLGGAVAIADFPDGTRQLAVEVLGSGGAVRAFGRTAPFELDALADGDVLPIFMAPPDDGCPVADLVEVRDRPLVIAAGDGALIVGGIGVDDAGDLAPLGTAEWYDPATGTFTLVDTPLAMRGPLGAVGMAAATMPDGRIVLTGGARPVYVVFDPATRTFAPPGALFEVRAHHAAVAIGPTRVLIAGGCGELGDLGVCTPPSDRLSSFVVDIASGENLDGPSLGVVRLDGTATLEPDPTASGVRRVVLSGGVDLAGLAVTDAERVDPDVGPGGSGGELLLGVAGVTAQLASGSLVVAFGADGAQGEASVIAPGQDAPRPWPDALARAAPTLTPLEDGSVLVLGGAGDLAPVARLRPADGSAAVLAADPIDLDGAATARAGHAAVRLLDGTVLAVGGRDPLGMPRAGAWVFRPAGDAPFTGAVTVTPGDDADAPLIALDPARVIAAPTYQLTAVGAPLTAWVVIGGMRPRELELAATMRIEGGVAVLLGFLDAEHFDAVELRAGALARLTRRDGGAASERCAGDALDAGTLGDGAPVTVVVAMRTDQLLVTIDGETVLSCAFEDARAGLTGVAALGDGAAVTLSTASVTR